MIKMNKTKNNPIKLKSITFLIGEFNPGCHNESKMLCKNEELEGFEGDEFESCTDDMADRMNIFFLSFTDNRTQSRSFSFLFVLLHLSEHELVDKEERRC